MWRRCDERAADARERRFARAAPTRKGLYILPSVFTAGNIAAGYYAISQAIQGTASDPWHFDHAAKAIGIAIVFDFFDGGIARLTNTASAFGRELDSLADVITFGVAPGGPGVDVGIPHAAADRRSRHSRPRDSIGSHCDLCVSAGGSFAAWRGSTSRSIPSPRIPAVRDESILSACRFRRAQERSRPSSIWCKGIRCNTGGCPSDGAFSCLRIAFLMVSTWRFFSLKGINFPPAAEFSLADRDRALVIALIWFSSQYVLFLLALVYILSGVLARLSFVFRRPTAPPPPPQDEASHA